MALSRFLRRTTPSLLLRSLAACSSSSCSTSHPLLLPPHAHRSPFASSFSSTAVAANKPPSDTALLRVLDSEIRCAEESDDHDRVEPVPEGFPFEIQDDKGTSIVRLTRTYQGKEHIEVTVSMPSLVTGEDEEQQPPNDDEDEGEQQASAEQMQPHIPLTVRVSKDDGSPTLEFACTAYPDEVVIDSMSVIESRAGGEGEGGDEDDLLAYEGPDFNDLDENLQKAFHKYLELRGITPLNTNFLHVYMINKDSREYLLWLRNLKAFLLK